ncbi:Pca regulon regulatory protein [mine drainage metagenome]|uniref:Pca regulon regulatory protein n=1 Tax=mine drainage metagenome TaxID=410659 RepID=A0A1J5RSW0_9ZZZZ
MRASKKSKSNFQQTSSPTRVDVGEGRHFVTSLARGLNVLSCFNAHDHVLGNQDIALRCKLPKSTVSRLTYTLTHLGYLVRADARGKYRLGPAMSSLGIVAALERRDIRLSARPLMQELANEAKAMVVLGTRSWLSMIDLEVCRDASSPSLMLDLSAGSRLPLATTAMGRANLAAMEQHERENLLDDLAALDAKAWPRPHRDIELALETVRTLGCACSFGDWRADVNAIAVAFNPGHGIPLMVIGCGGPAAELTPDFLLDAVRPKLLALERRLQGLGNS